MLTKRQIQDDAKRRLGTLLPYIVGGILASCLHLVAWIFFFNNLNENRHFAVPVLIGSFLLFFILLMIGQRKAAKFYTRCSLCDKNLNEYAQIVISSRRCPFCSSHIVEGSFRTDALLNRYRRHLNWQTGRRADWILMIFMLFPLLPFLHEVRDPNYPPVSWTFSLLMLVASAYLWFRTRNHRCALPFLASLILFTFGFWRFWNAATP